DIELAKSGIVASNYAFGVLIDYHCRRTEHNKVEVHDGKGIVEIGLCQYKHHPARYFIQPNALRRTYLILQSGNTKTKPRTAWRGNTVHHSCRKDAGGGGSRSVKDIGVLDDLPHALLRGLQPNVSTWKIKVRKLAPVRPPRLPFVFHPFQNGLFLIMGFHVDLHSITRSVKAFRYEPFVSTPHPR